MTLGVPVLTPEMRDRVLALAGIDLEDRGRPYPGQRYKHGWIPVGPTLTAAEQWHSNLRPVGHLIRAIHSGEKERNRLKGGLNATVHLVDYVDGDTAIEKQLEDVSDTFGHDLTPKRQADAEQAAGDLGQRFHVPVPPVLRTAPDTVVMDVVDGDPWSEIEKEALATGDPADLATAAAVREKLISSKDGIKLGLFDLVTDNWDRGNGNNWVVTDESTPAGYDHAFAWSGITRAGPHDPPVDEELSPFSAQFTAMVNGRRVWADNPLTPGDVRWLIAQLASMESDFDRLGRHDWYEFALARLEAIAPYAVGRDPVFT